MKAIERRSLRADARPGPVNLDALDDYPLSDHAPDDSMGLSDLDGFLAGIVVGPELIMPSEWFPVIGGGRERTLRPAEMRSVLARSWAATMRSSAVSTPNLRTSSQSSWRDQRAR